MKKRRYIKVYNVEENLYFKEDDLSEEDKKCFINMGYKVEAIIGLIKAKAYIESINRLKELKG